MQYKKLDHYQFPGKLIRGEIVPNSPKFQHGMLSMYEDCEIIVHIERRRHGKTLEQLGYLYGVVYPEVARHTGHSVEEIDLLMKAKFLKNKILWRGVDMIVPGEKAPLTSEELSEFISNVILEAGELGIEVPPADKEYRVKRDFP